ncbi:hypothetical protein ACVWXO_004316 [Bradyrhizobium sp. LM2.7]
MSKLKIVSAALIATAALASPAIARESQAATRHVAVNVERDAATAPRDIDGRLCVPAPRVGAFATAPWTGNNVPCEPGT